MGLKTINIVAREAVELACDNTAHRGGQPVAWFDCGSDFGNLSLAMAAGWEQRKANGMWLCPRCAQQDLNRDGVRNRADEAPRGAPPSARALSAWCLPTPSTHPARR